MIRSFEPPPRRRFRNPRLLEPAHQPLAPDAVLREFLSLRDALTRRVQQADGLDLERVIVVSPVSRFFRMPLGGYFAFLLAHDRRHLWQARQALGAGAAPGGLRGKGGGAAKLRPPRHFRGRPFPCLPPGWALPLALPRPPAPDRPTERRG